MYLFIVNLSGFALYQTVLAKTTMLALLGLGQLCLICFQIENASFRQKKNVVLHYFFLSRFSQIKQPHSFFLFFILLHTDQKH